MDAWKPVVAAAVVGVAAASLGSLAFAGRAEGEALAALTPRLGSPSSRAAKAASLGGSISLANAPPLFPVLSGPNAAREVTVRVDGLARSPTRTAALLSIDGGASGWFQLGESRDGVTLQEVGSSSVVVDTPRGPKTLRLGEGSPSPAAAAPGPGADVPPPGFRAPEPASAPGLTP